jgi:mannosyltransferase OCH1-like enzyme
MNIPHSSQIPKIDFELKETYNSIIPLNIFQTWRTKDIPNEFQNNINNIKNDNPEFLHFLYDDNDCRDFIKDNFKPDVLYAFDSLIPGAYKADLWRYCILFIKGGIYLDMRYKCINNFKFIALTEKEHFALDRNGNWMKGKHGIYNAIMVCKPKNYFLYKCIRQIVYNVKNKIYSINPLYPTGPGLLWLIHETDRNLIKNNIDIFHSQDGNYLIFNNRLILRSMENYDSLRHRDTEYYAVSWNNKNVYK